MRAPAGVGEQLSDHLAQPRHVARRDEDAGHVDEAADGRRHHRPAVRHRLPRDDAVALAARRDAHDRRPLVVRAELGARDEADRLRHVDAGPAPTITRGIPSVAARNSWMPFSGERRPTKSTCGGSSGSPTDVGDLDAARDDPHLARAELPGRLGQVLGGDDREPRPPQQRAEEPGRLPRQLDVRAPELNTYGFPVLSAASADGSQCAWTRSASRAARRAAHA